MDLLELTRLETSNTETLGVLTLNKQIFCYILEPPKRNNQRGKSCIPTGGYKCEKYKSVKYGVECLKLFDVPDRDYISMHYGNKAEDTKGCLITGTYTGILDGVRAVLRSRAALTALMKGIKQYPKLIIREAF